MRRLWLVLPVLLALVGCHRHDSEQNLAILAQQGQILQTAPVTFTGQITVAATPQQVFAVLEDIPGWPNWEREISLTVIGGQSGLGVPFSWLSAGYDTDAVIQRFIPGQSIAWTGKVANFHSIHVFNLSPAQGGGTVVTMQESVSGFLVGYFYHDAQAALTDTHWLAYLKAAAEGRLPPQF